MEIDDYDYIEIGSLPLREWMGYWVRGNEEVWRRDIHDVRQLQLELCEAASYVATLLKDIDMFMRNQEPRQPYPGEIDNAMLAGQVDSLKNELAMEREAHKSALNRCRALRDALEKIGRGLDCGCSMGVAHSREACPVYYQWNQVELLQERIEWMQRTARIAIGADSTAGVENDPGLGGINDTYPGGLYQ